MRTQEKTSWYEDDLFWQTFSPEMFTAEKLASAVPEAEQLIGLLSLQPGSKVLDLCCGVGRHSLELARRGYEVTGFDRTADYLEQGRKQAALENLNVNFVQGDMRRFCALDEFDAVINLYTSFGYFEDASDDKRVLLNVLASLKPGGKLLLDTMSREVMARIFQPCDRHEHNGRVFLRETRVTQDWSWIENRWVLLKDGERREFCFGHRLYSAVELKDLLRRCGFTDVKVFGALTGVPYDHQAQRLVVAAAK